MLTAKALLEYTDIAPANAFVQEHVPNSFLELQLEFNAEIQRAEVEYNRAYYRALTESIIHEKEDGENKGFFKAIGKAILAFCRAIKNAIMSFIGLFKKKKDDTEKKAEKVSKTLEDIKNTVEGKGTGVGKNSPEARLLSARIESEKKKITDDLSDAEKEKIQDKINKLTAKYQSLVMDYANNRNANSRNEADAALKRLNVLYARLNKYDVLNADYPSCHKIIDFIFKQIDEVIGYLSEMVNSNSVPNSIKNKFSLEFDNSRHSPMNSDKEGYKEKTSNDFKKVYSYYYDAADKYIEGIVGSGAKLYESSWVSKLIDTKSEEMSFKDFSAYFEKVRKTITDQNTVFEKKINDLNKVTSKLNTIAKAVSKIEHIDADKNRDRNDFIQFRSQYTTMNTFIHVAKDQVNNTLKIVNTMINQNSKYIDYCNHVSNAMLKRMRNSDNDEEATNESAYIHGEPFNGNTLFDNEDIRDFNRTEWLDLRIATEYYQFESDILDIKEKLALKEAVILTDPTITNKLIRLREEQEAAKEGFWARVKKFFQKVWDFFMSFFKKAEEISAKAAENIDANNEFVAKPFEFPKDQVKSKGNIIAGMYRIQDNLNFVPFDNSVIEMLNKENGKQEFFRSKLLNTFNNNSNFSKVKNLPFENETKIADWCKAYYGAAFPDEEYKKTYETQIVFTNAELNQNKDNIIKFVKNIKSYTSSIEADKNKIEAECKRLAENLEKNKAQNNASNTPPPQNDNKTEENKGTGAKQEYYSILYGRNISINAFNEVEFAKDDTANNANTKESENEEKAIKAYIEVYNEIISAKLTAAEFIHSELNGIITEHIRIQGGKNKEEAAKEGEKKAEEKPAEGQK